VSDLHSAHPGFMGSVGNTDRGTLERVANLDTGRRWRDGVPHDVSLIGMECNPEWAQLVIRAHSTLESAAATT